MFFHETPIHGAFLIELELRPDDRGFFARTVCVDELSAHGLNANFVQQSISWNPLAGTLRGMHFQAPPNLEDKLVRVTRGSCFDVFFDMRKDSPSFGKWHGKVLSADNHCSFYIPKGCAHGYQILEPNTEVFYQMSERYQPGGARGFAYDDNEVRIDWPMKIDATDRRLLSQADAKQPSWAEVRESLFV